MYFPAMRAGGHHVSGTRRPGAQAATSPGPRCRRWLCACLGVLALVANAQAVAGQGHADPRAATAIVGDWLVANHGAIIRIAQTGDGFGGSIAWQLHDRYGPEDGPALDGKIVTDRHNADPALRSRPLTGLPLLTGLRYDPADNEWVGGRIYDTNNGHTYRCIVRLAGPDRLVLRGYLGIRLFGKNTYWRRVVMRKPAAGEPPYVMVATSE